MCVWMCVCVCMRVHRHVCLYECVYECRIVGVCIVKECATVCVQMYECDTVYESVECVHVCECV